MSSEKDDFDSEPSPEEAGELFSTPLGGFVDGLSPLGKYLLIEAPRFNSYDGGEPMSSYLRLGAVKDPTIAGRADAPRASGEDLASYVQDFIDDTRKRREGDNSCPHWVSQQERQAETARLHTKGGWRDHSDGNRISTTRGDKVEVIGGNYRRLVLGRRDDREYEAGWDVSGGHVSESGITFEGESHIEWVKTWDGTWRVVEKSVKGDVFTTYHGDTHDWHYGNIKHSTTGSESPGEQQDNPEIVDKTWARAISSYTGSSSLPVPSIEDETWAESISSVTNADTIKDETSATLIDSTTNAALVNNLTVANTLDVTVGTATSVFVGMETEIVTGNMNEVTLGMENSLTLGVVTDITCALMLEVELAGKFEVSLGGSIKYEAVAEYDVTPKHVKAAVANFQASTENTVISAFHNIF